MSLADKIIDLTRELHRATNGVFGDVDNSRNYTLSHMSKMVAEEEEAEIDDHEDEAVGGDMAPEEYAGMPLHQAYRRAILENRELSNVESSSAASDYVEREDFLAMAQRLEKLLVAREIQQALLQLRPLRASSTLGVKITPLQCTVAHRLAAYLDEEDQSGPEFEFPKLKCEHNRQIDLTGAEAQQLTQAPLQEFVLRLQNEAHMRINAVGHGAAAAARPSH